MEAMSLAAVVVPIVCNAIGAGIRGGLPPMPQGRLPSVPRLSLIHLKRKGAFSTLPFSALPVVLPRVQDTLSQTKEEKVASWAQLFL